MNRLLLPHLSQSNKCEGTKAEVFHLIVLCS